MTIAGFTCSPLGAGDLWFPLHRVGLLDRAESVSVQFGVPAAQGRLEPVAVGAANLSVTLLGQSGKYLIEAVRCGVVGIDQEGDRGRVSVTREQSRVGAVSAGSPASGAGG
ncbi:MAG: hypothetical protein AAGC63_09320 [Propionicimonas sp.]|nr:hypothetical protein [Propionicimonas sp.]